MWLASPVLGALTAGRVEPPIEAVALAGGLALFLPGISVLTWKEAERDVEWGGIMLIVAGLSLGLVVFETGAARWLAWVLLGGIVRCAGRAPTVRDRAGGCRAAPDVLEQHGDGEHHRADPGGAGAGSGPRRLDGGGARGVYVLAGVHPRERRADDHHSVLVRLLLDQGHGQSRRGCDGVGGRLRRSVGAGQSSAGP